MFGAAIIVFRESLEAALLIGIIAAATRGLDRRNQWIAAGVGAGLIGSLLVAFLAESIANLAEGTGQELFNAAILGTAVLMLGWHNIWMASHGAEMAKNAKLMGQQVQSGQQERSAIAVVIALAVLREGSETVLFLHGLAFSATGGASTVLAGAGAGLVGGIAAGIAMYFGLLRIPVRWFFAVTSGLLLLLAAGLASQMARFLIQADRLPALASPLWDTSHILPVDSVVGTALHVLIGYDAEPSGMQVLFYGVTLFLIWLGTMFVRRQKQFLTTVA